MAIDSSNTTSTSSLTSSAARATSRGTQIQQTNGGMDKDSFLKILSAELANQDPDNPADSTQYVAQMAQFANLEQFDNLNTTMSFSAASTLIGKTVALDAVDSQGNQYIGTVKGVTKSGSDVLVNVMVNDAGTAAIKQFPISQVSDVADVSDSSTSTSTTSGSTSTNTSSSSATSSTTGSSSNTTTTGSSTNTTTSGTSTNTSGTV